MRTTRPTAVVGRERGGSVQARGSVGTSTATADATPTRETAAVRAKSRGERSARATARKSATVDVARWICVTSRPRSNTATRIVVMAA